MVTNNYSASVDGKIYPSVFKAKFLSQFNPFSY